ncbi:hypothetical protein HK097_008073, partial [Rhizophlyctis rosea]
MVHTRRHTTTTDSPSINPSRKLSSDFHLPSTQSNHPPAQEPQFWGRFNQARGKPPTKDQNTLDEPGVPPQGDNSPRTSRHSMRLVIKSPSVSHSPSPPLPATPSPPYIPAALPTRVGPIPALTFYSPKRADKPSRTSTRKPAQRYAPAVSEPHPEPPEPAPTNGTSKQSYIVTLKRRREDIPSALTVPSKKKRTRDSSPANPQPSLKEPATRKRSRTDEPPTDTPIESERKRSLRRKQSLAPSAHSDLDDDPQPHLLTGSHQIWIASSDSPISTCRPLTFHFPDADSLQPSTSNDPYLTAHSPIDVPSFEIIKSIALDRGERVGKEVEDTSDEAYQHRHKRLEFAEKRVKNREKELFQHALYKRREEERER